MTFLSIDSTQHLFVHKMLGITPITNCSKLEGLDMIIFLIDRVPTISEIRERSDVCFILQNCMSKLSSTRKVHL